jgi:hypothetical protein
MPSTKSPSPKIDRSKLGRRSRNKGKAFEQAIARDLQIIWPEARRGIGQARSGGEVPDISHTPWWVECKHMKRCNIQAAVKQAREAAAGKDELPVMVVTKDNGGEVLATLPWALLIHILQYSQYSQFLGIKVRDKVPIEPAQPVQEGQLRKARDEIIQAAEAELVARRLGTSTQPAQTTKLMRQEFKKHLTRMK